MRLQGWGCHVGQLRATVRTLSTLESSGKPLAGLVISSEFQKGRRRVE